MKRNYKIVGCLLILGILSWSLFPTSSPTKPHKGFVKKEKSSNPTRAKVVTSKGIQQERDQPKIQRPISNTVENKRIPTNHIDKFYKYSQVDPFEAYPKLQISNQYAIVKGLFVSFQKTPSAIRSIGGLHYYEEGQIQGGHLVVFDKAQEKYAMWSGEVIIEASDKHLDEILRKFDMEVVSKSPGRIIIKAGPDFILSEDLQSVEKFMGIDSLSLDLKYSKLMRQ